MNNCVGHYQLHKRIFANPVLARYAATARLFPGFNKPCVVQVVSKNVVAEETFVEGLRREAALVLRIAHPNVLTILDIAEYQGQWVIACEGVDGCDLSSFHHRWWSELRQPPPQEAVLFIARELLTGLDYCYRMARQVYGGIKRVYRELGPNNVLLSREGVVKLADFGLGISSSRRQLLEPRDDFFKIGVALFELMIGEQTSPDSDFVALSARLPLQIRRILLNAVERRYASVVEFRNDVQHTLAKVGPRFGGWELANLVRRQLDGNPQEKKTLALSIKPTQLVADKTIVDGLTSEEGNILFDDEELATHPVTAFSRVGSLAAEPDTARHSAPHEAQIIDLRRGTASKARHTKRRRSAKCG